MVLPCDHRILIIAELRQPVRDEIRKAGQRLIARDGMAKGQQIAEMPAEARRDQRQHGFGDRIGGKLRRRRISEALFGGFAVLAQSIRSQIYTLPDDTIVFPGHGPRTTVGEEKATNPYVPLIAAARPV